MNLILNKLMADVRVMLEDVNDFAAYSQMGVECEIVVNVTDRVMVEIEDIGLTEEQLVTVRKLVRCAVVAGWSAKEIHRG